jgi:uncharacterized protein (TIRG00374 family)
VVKTAIRLSVSLGISAVFVWLSLRGTDVREVARAMAAAPILPLAGYLGILLVVHLVRTVRWMLLLEPVGPVSFRRANAASAVGFMLLMLLPLRLGELARPLLVARPRSGEPWLRRSGAIASCVAERVVDGLMVGLLGIVALRMLGPRATGQAAEFIRHASSVVVAGFAVLCALIALALVFRRRGLALLHSVGSRLAPRITDRATSALDTFLSTWRLGSPLRVLAVLALTAAHWALHVCGFWLLAPAFGMSLTPLMACAVVVAQVVGVMIPAGPGMVGTSQFFTRAGLSIFVPGALSVPAVAAAAAAYANTIWMLQLGQQVALGLVFWLAGNVRLSEVVGVQAAASEAECAS